MEMIKTLYVTGYRSFELGIFQGKDPKITVIKNVLKKELASYIEAGVEWILISGNLGVELWTAEVVGELKMEYPEVQLGLLYPFKDFGNNWNEQNRELLSKAESLADYINSVSHQTYQSPAQLKMHTKFLLEHSGGSLLIYDKEYSGKTEYFLKDAQHFSEREPYDIRLITMDDLQNSVID